jgi:hypothetical protein
MTPLSFKRHRFAPSIIRHYVWLYARFTLSYRDVEEMLAERGVDVSYETVRRWFLKFGPAISHPVQRTAFSPSTPPPTTHSTTSVTRSAVPTTRTFGPVCSRRGHQHHRMCEQTKLGLPRSINLRQRDNA